ncbi:MAG: hypothetical protein Kow00107_01150 [Planctomycetota bacterium]
MTDSPPPALSLDVTHDTVVALLRSYHVQGSVLDCGAGRGALSWRLFHRLQGVQVYACDLFPEQFEVKEVPCRKADLNRGFPFEDGSFDAVCAVEVVEHLENRFDYFRELNRVLKPGGLAIITTPNIVNLASRLRFLFSGFYTLFKPLDERFGNPLHDHITPLPWYYYRYSFVNTGFEFIDLRVDRLKKGAMALALLYPIMWLYTRYSIGRDKNEAVREANRRLIPQLLRLDLLFGRTVIMVARKARDSREARELEYNKLK